MPLNLPADGSAGQPVNQYAPAGGIPNYNSDAPNRFTPVIYSPLFVEKFYDATVFGEICNTDYEGDISGYGDKVIIRTTGDTTIDENYRSGKKLNYGYYDSQAIELVIDQQHAFAMGVDRLQRHQADVDYVDDFIQDQAMKMQISVDRKILAQVGAQASATTSGNTAGAKSASFDMGTSGAGIVLDKTNVVDFLIDMSSVFDEASVPDDGSRCVVLPPKIINLIAKSDLQDASYAGDDTSMARNLMIGMVAGMRIYKSNLLAQTGTGAAAEWNVIACHKSAITFAAQIDDKNLEVIPNPDAFGELMRGLLVFGFKVIKDDGLISAHARAA